MSEQFGLNLDPLLIQRLSETFPKASGRDIKGLAKLVSKYVTHKAVEPSLEVFRRCAVFRGMDLGQTLAPNSSLELTRSTEPSMTAPLDHTEACC